MILVMETNHDLKIEQQIQSMQEPIKLKSELSSEDPPKMSNIQAKRRFMITDILNSAVESKEQKGLDMRLLFPGVNRYPLNHSQHDFNKLHQAVNNSDVEGDSEADDENEDGDDKGKNFVAM